MSGLDIDIAYVRRHTLRPVLSAFVAAIALLVAVWIHDAREEQYSHYAANHDAVHEDYDAFVFQRRLVDRYHRRYQRYHDLGFIGRESRLDWIETLRTTAESLRLPHVSYAIEPQLSAMAPVESVMGADNIRVHVSRARLDMGLLHELDLLRFFDELQAAAPGLIKVDDCALTWLADTQPPSPVEANLSAVCSIQIFSVITSDVSSGET